MKDQRSARRAPLIGAKVLLSSGLLLITACNDYEPAVYTAQAYRAAEGCLEPYAPVGVVQVEQLSSRCDATCLVDANGALYVSTVCPPFPDTFTSDVPEAIAPDCSDALAAAADDVQCDAEPDAGM